MVFQDTQADAVQTLTSGIVALDTEDDRYSDGCRRTRLLQICSVSAQSPEDVVVFEGFGAWSMLFGAMEQIRQRKTIDIRCYNLGGYEFSHMLAEVLRPSYVYTEEKPAAGEWTALADDKTVYSVTVRTFSGTLVRFTDDMRRMQNVSMETAAEGVRRQHPDWWPDGETKGSVSYDDGWLDPDGPEYAKALEYARLDAFSQAMIARWLHERGYDASLTSPGMGLKAALSVRYGKHPLHESGYQDFRWNAMAFRKHYPPLDREMQDIAEQKLLGGFVWGLVGVWQGSFVHLDYSSSYPYEYAYGRLFSGRVWRLFPGDEVWDDMMCSTMMFRWFRVSFRFRLREGMMPAISGRECAESDGPRRWGSLTGQLNKKMREGSVHHGLYTESYLRELGKHYEISDMKIEEMWVAKAETGDFEPFIRRCYEQKNSLKKRGLGKSADYQIWKGFMNAGIHGKTITKTNRRKRTFYDDGTQLVPEVSDPTMSFMIGFTAMMNARERLLRHCRMLIEAGHRIYMCDTDSIVTDGTVEEVEQVIGDWFAVGGTMEQDLGRFEVEDDGATLRELGLELEVRQTFDEFRCWGLKRYLEIRHEGDELIVRKTAFAGMHDEIQTRMMLDLPVDGSLFEWHQTGKLTGAWGAQIVEVCKHARAEDVWYHPDNEEMSEDEIEKRLERSKRLLDEVYKSAERGEWEPWD